MGGMAPPWLTPLPKLTLNVPALVSKPKTASPELAPLAAVLLKLSGGIMEAFGFVVAGVICSARRRPPRHPAPAATTLKDELTLAIEALQAEASGDASLRSWLIGTARMASSLMELT